MASSNTFAVDPAALSGSTDTIIVVVGQGAEQLQYQVDKNLILQHSRLIRHEFSTRALDNTRTYTITNCVHPSTFGLIQNWLNTQELRWVDGSPLNMMDLHKMHVLAFRLGMIGLQHDILAALINCPFPDMVLPLAKYIFRYSWALSKAKQLFIDQCAFQLDDDKWCKESLSFPRRSRSWS